jgi:hypothetical protein
VPEIRGLAFDRILCLPSSRSRSSLHKLLATADGLPADTQSILRVMFSPQYTYAPNLSFNLLGKNN